MRVLKISSAGGSVAVAFAPPPHSVATGSLSSWHSPVPYRFDGVAATIGLIVVALLILACTYWKLSGDLNPIAPRTPDSPSAPGSPGDPAAARHEEQLLVIMPGDHIPSALAIPIDSRTTAESNIDKIPSCDKEAPEQSAHMSRSEQRI